MTAAAAPGDSDDLAALAKGGRTNTLGFVVRLIARIPFLVIATRLYGAEALGRFASALVLIEIVALLCSLGEKRGLAQRLRQRALLQRQAVLGPRPHDAQRSA